MGLGNSSGFEFVVQSLAGAPPTDLAAVARGMMVSAQQVPQLASVFTTYAAADAADQPQARPRARPGAGRVDLRHLLGDADDARRHLHQRLQPVRPDLAGEGAGRRARSQQRQRHLPRARALVERRAAAAAGRGQRRADHRAVLDRALQQPALGGAERRAGARLLVGPGDRRHGDARQVDAARRLRLRMDRHGAAGEGGERPDRLHPGAGRAVRLPLPGRPLREHGDPDRRAAVGRGRPVRRGAGAATSPVSTTTSSPRSASSC